MYDWNWKKVFKNSLSTKYSPVCNSIGHQTVRTKKFHKLRHSITHSSSFLHDRFQFKSTVNMKKISYPIITQIKKKINIKALKIDKKTLERNIMKKKNSILFSSQSLKIFTEIKWKRQHKIPSIHPYIFNA